MNLTKEEADMLRHMLGINNPYEKPRPYRNYAAVLPGNVLLERLQAKGLVVCYRKADSTTIYDWFKCTEAGKKWALISHKNIIKSKAARRYRKYLKTSDAVPDLGFKEFISSSEFKEIREEV